MPSKIPMNFAAHLRIQTTYGFSLTNQSTLGGIMVSHSSAPVMRRSTHRADRRPENQCTRPTAEILLPNRVISFSARFELLWSRGAVLRSAGFEVFSTISSGKALAKIRSGQYGCFWSATHFLSGCGRQRQGKFRESCPHGKLIRITDARSPQPSVGADRVVYGADGAEALIAAVEAKATGHLAQLGSKSMGF
jgi:hypothetical protein